MLDSQDIHPSATKGFEAAPQAYERGRAGYPLEATRVLAKELRISGRSTVLDLGAGTGKLCRALLPTNCRLIAVDPVAAMRDTLSQQVPGVEVLHGRAEDIPLDRGSVDAVICAQAFHWFDGAAALKEIHRVLKPGGRLGLIWNVREESVDWVARLTRIIDPYAGDTPRYRTGQWKNAFTLSKLFTGLSEAHFDHEHRLSIDAAIDRVTSISFIAALPEDARQKVIRETRSVLQTHPHLRESDEVTFPYRVEMFWSTRIDPS